MSKRGDKELLYDINEAIKRINEYIGNMDYESFLIDHKTQDAIIRNLEIIGEAVKNISDDSKREYTNIQWKDIAGLRDKLIHFYFGINWDIVWSVVKDKLPVLKETVNEIIELMD